MHSWFDNDSAFPDLIIICGPKQIKVHRVILCDKSEWFQRALTGEFLESRAGTIELYDDDPDAIYELLRWCYTLDLPAAVRSDDDESLVGIIKLYAAAEKYLVKDLVTVLAERFWETAPSAWSTRGFTLAIAEAYTTTSDVDRRVRDPIVDIVLEHADELLASPGQYRVFHEVMDSTPEFAADVARALVWQQQQQLQGQGQGSEALQSHARWRVTGHELVFARSLGTGDIHPKLQCDTCHKLAINAEKLHCCNSMLCGDCLGAIYGPSCPVCETTLLDREKNTLCKTIQTTCKIFLKIEARKCGIDLKTGHRNR